MKIVGCFLEYDGKFLILLRHSHKPEGGTWGLPAGKVDSGETEDKAMMRELYEETGFHAAAKDLERLGSFEFQNPRGIYTFTAYRVLLHAPYQPSLEQRAHTDGRWVTPAECAAHRDLIPDFHELLSLLNYVPN